MWVRGHTFTHAHTHAHTCAHKPILLHSNNNISTQTDTAGDGESLNNTYASVLYNMLCVAGVGGREGEADTHPRG